MKVTGFNFFILIWKRFKPLKFLRLFVCLESVYYVVCKKYQKAGSLFCTFKKIVLNIFCFKHKESGEFRAQIKYCS